MSPANARAPTGATQDAELRVFEGAGRLKFAERSADMNRDVRPLTSGSVGRDGGAGGLKGAKSRHSAVTARSSGRTRVRPLARDQPPTARVRDLARRPVRVASLRPG